MSSTRFDKTMEICKLIVSIMMPIIIGVSGYFIQQNITSYQSRQAVNKELSVRLADRRLALYDKIKVPLNQIYCYIEEIGNWDQMSVAQIRTIRQEINETMYANRAVWSPGTFQLYQKYIDNVAFEAGSRYEQGRIRAELSPRRMHSAGWQKKESEALTGSVHPDHQKIYRLLNEALAMDLMSPYPSPAAGVTSKQ